MTTDPTPDRAHRATFTVTVTSRPDGGHYLDQADFAAHVAQWVRTDLRGHHAVAEVTATAAPPATDRAGLREQVAGVLRPHASLGGTPPRYELPFFDGATPSLPRISGWRPLDDVATAVLSVLLPGGRASVLLWAADQIDAETRQLKADQVLEPDKYRPCRDASAQLRRLAAGERDEQQAQGEAEAHEPLHRWRVEILDGGEWMPCNRTFGAHSIAVDRYQSSSEQAPAWADGEPVHRRLVRETTTFTVEQTAAAPATGQPPADPPPVAFSGKGRVWCLSCPRSDGEDVPVTIDVVCYGELCAGCGRDVVDVARATEQPATDTTDEARKEIECANCRRVVENRSTPNMGGPSRDHWVHIPGGFQPCFPQRGADSPRAEPELTVMPQPETVHGCPPDGSGLTPCCGRTPSELPLTDRISSEVPVTCKGV